MRNKVLLVCLMFVLLGSLVAGSCTEPAPTPTPAPTPPPAPAPTPPPAPPPPKVTELKLASPMPPAQMLHTEIWDWWAKELEERTEGRVKVAIYPAGALGDAMVIWENTLKGVCDIGCVGNYTPARFPVMDFRQWLPLRIPNYIASNHITWHLYYQGLLEPELGEFKFLYPTDPGPIPVCTSKKQIMTLNDFKGLRIRVLGSCPALEQLGADTVGMPLSEVHTALERGMIDGLITGPSVIAAAGLEKVVRYISLQPFSYGGWYIVMNRDVWNNLPLDIQYIIDVLNQETYYSRLVAFSDDWAWGVEVCEAAGIEFYSAAPGELERWKAETAGLADEWVAAYEAKGLPGKKVKEEVLKILVMYE